MFPGHQFYLYPRQRNEMQSTPHHYPTFGAIPPQVRADPDRLYCQSWPWSSNYGYAYPTQFHGRYEHNHFPGYYGLRSPYAQVPTPYYHGNYPVPPGEYPIHYVPPPPHHTVELPCYECDKDIDGYYHCCGCPNNPFNRKGGKNVKIEEEDPHLENIVNESPVPFNFKNYPDPLVLCSPSNIKTKVGEWSNDPHYEKQEDSSHSAKTHYPYPILWFPSNQIMTKENNTSNEPLNEKQEDDSSSAKTNYPYPLLWFPPTYIGNKEDSMSNEPQDEEQEGSSKCSKTQEISKPSQEQRDFGNGWFPFDMNKLRPLKSRSSRQQLQQQADDKPGFPCPVFWIPYKPDEKESKDHKGTGVDQECEERAKSHFEVSPVMVPATERNNNSKMNDEIIGHKGPKEMVKTNIQKTIPVKQAEPNEGEKNKEKAISSEMPLNCSEAGKSSEDGGKRKSPSPTESSKLPPVCLRVEPLPRKKNANGSSRSPSPPGDKGKSNEVSRENVKPTTSLDPKEIPQPGLPSGDAMPKREKDKGQHKSKTKTIQVSGGTGSQAGNSDSLPNSSLEGVLASQTNYKSRDAVDDLSATDVKCKSVTGANSEGAAEDKSMHLSCQTDENEEKSRAEQEPANRAKESKRINLSEAEAARIIQSAYRGYEVRRWEPLKKLKQVMEVSKKVAELKSSIQAFESSPDIQGVDKWRTIISETIMNLLLKLDTIQGMHPSIRDVRKSVAKELVGLQEKVDHLTQKKAETMSQQASPVLFGENMENKDDLSIKKGQEEEKQEHENSQSETDPVNEFHLELACEGESNNPRVHAVTNSGNLDTTEMVKDDGENPRESITGVSSTETELQNGGPRLDASTNSENPDMPVMVTDEGENYLEQISKASSAETELEKRVVFPQIGDQTINPALEGTRSLLANEVSELKELEELPIGELSEDTCMPDNLVQNKPQEDTAPEDEVLNKLPKGIIDENADIQDNFLVKNDTGENEVLTESYLEPKELAQLPQGVLDDDNSESNMHLHIEIEGEKGKTDAVTVDINAEVVDDKLPDMNQVEPGQEATLKVPATSEANESLECAEDEDNNAELLEMVDHGSEDVVQAPEEESSLKSKAMDEPEVVHGNERTVSNAEVFNAKSEVSGYFAAEDEKPALTTTTESKEVSETSEEEVPERSFLESESVCALGGENRLTDSNNPSNKNASQECDLPAKSSKSCDVEHEDKRLNDNFELQASGGVAGIDRTYAQPCDSGALEGELPDHEESFPLKAKQTEEQVLPLSSSSASQISLESDAVLEGDKKLIEENMRLREMMQKLIEAGQEQLTAISNLSSRVKDLKKRISKKKKLKMRRNSTLRLSSSSSCLKPSNDPLREKAVALAM